MEASLKENFYRINIKNFKTKKKKGITLEKEYTPIDLDILEREEQDLDLTEFDRYEIIRNIHGFNERQLSCQVQFVQQKDEEEYLQGVVLVSKESCKCIEAKDDIVEVDNEIMTPFEELHVYRVRRGSIFTKSHSLRKFDIEEATNRKRKNRIWRKEIKQRYTEADTTKPILLMIHGTCGALNGFYDFVINPQTIRVLNQRYGPNNIIGFRHPTLEIGVEQNSQELYNLLGNIGLLDGGYNFDIITSSRGCLVARNFIKLLQQNRLFLLNNINKVVMVVPPNQGTPLANLLGGVFDNIMRGLMSVFPLAPLILMGNNILSIYPGLRDQQCGVGTFANLLNIEMNKIPYRGILGRCYTIACNFLPEDEFVDTYFQDNQNDSIVPYTGAGGESAIHNGISTGVALNIPERNIRKISDGPKHGRQFEDNRVVNFVLDFLSSQPIV